MIDNKNLTAFVPNGDSRRATAKALVDLAEDNGIDSGEAIFASNGGFLVTDELADLLGGDEDQTVGDIAADLALDPDNRDKSVPATQTRAQSHEGLGDSTAGGLQHTKVEQAHDANGNAVDEDGNPITTAAPVDYSSWEYAALKAEVAERGIEVENQKGETLVAALTADDLSPADEIE